MSNIDRKARVREYMENLPPAGIFRIRNTTSGRSLVGSAANLPGALNRHRFQLENGSHSDKELQADWKELGADAFTFETLDQLKPSEEPDYDPTEDLAVLKQMWIDKLADAGETLYRQSSRDT
jgi:hypothetical protein